MRDSYMASVPAGAMTMIALAAYLWRTKCRRSDAPAVRGRTGEGSKPQERFQKVLADTSDGPFEHLSARGMSSATKGRDNQKARVNDDTANASDGAPVLHPYRAEIELLLSSNAATLDRCVPLPSPSGPGDWIWVDTLEALLQLAQELSCSRQFSVDTEHNAARTYRGLTCLLQISTERADYLVDALVLHDELGDALRAPFADPSILKVMHSCDNDLMWLQRDFHLYVVNIFDTQKACQVLAKPLTSLAWLLREYCCVDADKVQQVSDWRLRPLSPQQLQYAVADSRYLRYIASRLADELEGGAGARRLGAGNGGNGSGGGGGGGNGKSRSKPSSSTPPLQRAVHRSQAMSLLLYSKVTHEEATSAATAALFKRYAQAARQQRQQQPGAGDGPGSGIMQHDKNLHLGNAHRLRAASDLAAAQRLDQQGEERAGRQGSRERDAANEREGTNAAASQQGGCGGGSHGGAGCSGGNGKTLNPGAGCGDGGGKGSGVVEDPMARLRSSSDPLKVLAARIHALCEWRDTVARELDEGVQYVLPDAALVAIAQAPSQLIRQPRQLRAVAQAAARLAAELSHQWPPLVVAAAADGDDEDEEEGQVVTPPAVALAAYDLAMLGRDSAKLCALLAQADLGQREWPGWRSLAAAAGRVDRKGRDLQQQAERYTRLVQKFSSKKPVYEGCRMLSQGGELLCHADMRKVEWYLSKGLAVKVCDSPVTIRLTFEHNCTDQLRGSNEFYTFSKSNCCVVCGEDGHYLRYRVFPSCYRRHLPTHLKSHRSHDVVLLCVPCHEAAMKVAERLKRVIADEFVLPLTPPPPSGARHYPDHHYIHRGHNGSLQGMRQLPEPAAAGSSTGAAATAAAPAAATQAAALQQQQPVINLLEVRRAAVVLQRFGDRLPADRRRVLEDLVCQYLGQRPAGCPPPPPQQQVMVELPPQQQVRVELLPQQQVRVELPPQQQVRVERTEGIPDAKAAEEAEEGGETAAAVGEEVAARGGVRGGKDSNEQQEGGQQQKEQDQQQEQANEDQQQKKQQQEEVDQQQEEQQQQQLRTSLSEAQIRAALVAGLGPRQRRRVARTWGPLPPSGESKFDTTGASPAAAVTGEEEGAAGCGAAGGGSGGGGGGSAGGRNGAGNALRTAEGGAAASVVANNNVLLWDPAAPSQGGGHSWHGKSVMEVLYEQGGEPAVLQLVRRFRAAFVEALQPRHLPPNWSLDHEAKRSFGAHSVYHQEGDEGMQKGHGGEERMCTAQATS